MEFKTNQDNIYIKQVANYYECENISNEHNNCDSNVHINKFSNLKVENNSQNIKMMKGKIDINFENDYEKRKKMDDNKNFNKEIENIIKKSNITKEKEKKIEEIKSKEISINKTNKNLNTNLRNNSYIKKESHNEAESFKMNNKMINTFKMLNVASSYWSKKFCIKENTNI